MSPEENKRSNGEIKIGEKMSLKSLLDIYSTTVGKGLILKSTVDVESFKRG